MKKKEKIKLLKGYLKAANEENRVLRSKVEKLQRRFDSIRSPLDGAALRSEQHKTWDKCQ